MTRALPLTLVPLLLLAPLALGGVAAPGCVTLALSTQADAIAFYPIVGDSVGVAAQGGAAGAGAGVIAFVTPALCHVGGQTQPPSTETLSSQTIPALP